MYPAKLLEIRAVTEAPMLIALALAFLAPSHAGSPKEIALPSFETFSELCVNAADLYRQNQYRLESAKLLEKQALESGLSAQYAEPLYQERRGMREEAERQLALTIQLAEEAGTGLLEVRAEAERILLERAEYDLAQAHRWHPGDWNSPEMQRYRRELAWKRQQPWWERSSLLGRKEEVEARFRNLPEAFDNCRIGHIAPATIVPP